MQNQNKQIDTDEIEVHPDEFALVGFTESGSDDVRKAAGAIFVHADIYLIFADPYETTLIIPRKVLDNVPNLSAEARVETGYRLITFTRVMDLSVVGFLARVSDVLARAGVPILALSAFSRDHLLIRQTDLDAALAALDSAQDISAPRA